MKIEGKEFILRRHNPSPEELKDDQTNIGAYYLEQVGTFGKSCDLIDGFCMGYGFNKWLEKLFGFSLEKGQKAIVRLTGKIIEENTPENK